ncbi:DUF3017 domain-containing protein [Streptomyces sp. NPDC085927]|uniref:DUF3017 domain-containing protein n=1 Tax=Streptomyces sp. NPDC085927 TaxID=3365738 RepID=UPI0037D157AA
MPADHSAREAETRARGTGTNPGGTQEREQAQGEEEPPEQEQGQTQGQAQEQEQEPVEDVLEDVAVEDFTVTDPVSAPDAEGRPRRVTRRFPLFTRDTARPEGGGRAAPGDAPAPARQWPILAVLLMAGLGLLLTAFDLFRVGTLLIGAALLAGGVLRWAVPDVGMLAVRSRFTDIVTYGGLGLAIVLLALMVQPHPLLEIPFLKDTLHFTVSNS